MTRRPAFWLGFGLVALVATGFAYRYFPQAFPLVSIELTMDREAALAAARELAARHRLGPPGSRQAASFVGDTEAQTFIELEGGGKAAFARMLRLGLYAAYQWRVRHFAPGETNETLFRFTPDGRPYGFREKIPEDAPGASLPTEAARRIAETGALAWGVALERFQLIEAAREVRPAGRVDHTFVYERPDERLNEGRYRLRLVVAGDRLTEVTYFVHVPEAFSRRYAEMRSANLAINLAANAAMIVLYVLGGIAVGLLVLLRQRWVVWRPALLWGVVVALLQVAAMFNSWPLVWMQYDTALAVERFVLQQIAVAIATFIGMAVFFGLSFMAAESLTRRAFPQHPQLWRLFARPVAASPALLGRTCGGYLLVALFFAYEVALYFVSTRLLGWWTPSDLLFHPDVLATYLPWLTAIAVSFQAGFWEEALFRAVPLAGAALLGERFGRRRLFVGVAFVLQALVFGAGHAAYATQPAYARLVELILPSFAFGWLYLRYGLLPGIVLHFTFDTVWFALPLFVARTPGIWIDRAAVVFWVLAPLWVILWQRGRAGRWQALDPAYLNREWTPPPPPPRSEGRPLARPGALPGRARAGLAVAGSVGVLVFVVVGLFGDRVPVPVLTTTRTQAASTARRVLAEQGVALSPEWRVLPRVDASRSEAHRFVWETAGRERYTALLGAYLPVPEWAVRVATFEGDVAERAEEWWVRVSAHGGVTRIRHVLPEARPGASLTETQARTLAETFVREHLGLDPAHLRAVSAEPTRRPRRTDWTFTFADTTAVRLPQGEPRLRVVISGDRVTDAERFVFVPEAWQRADRNRRTVLMVLNLARWLVLVGLLVAAAVAAIVAWSRGRFVPRLGLAVAAVTLGASLAQVANGWPEVVAGWRTDQPVSLQLLMELIEVGVSSLVVSVVAGLGAGVAPRWVVAPSRPKPSVIVGVGVALGSLAAGARALVEAFRAGRTPTWPTFEGAGSYVPALAPALDAISTYVFVTVVLLLVTAWATWVTEGCCRRRLLIAALLLLFGVLAGGTGEYLAVWAVAGAVSGLLLLVAVWLVARSGLAVVPVGVGTLAVLGLARSGIDRAFPGALAGHGLAILVVAGLASWWAAALQRAASAADRAAA